MEKVTVTISIISFLLSIGSFIFTWKVHNDSVKHDRKQATLDAFNLLQNQVLDEINKYQKKQVAEIALHPRSQEYKELSGKLARVEHFCVGVNSGIYDAETLKRLAGKYFISVYDKLYPLIDKKRIIYPNDKHYNEFEMLIDNIKKMYNDKTK